MVPCSPKRQAAWAIDKTMIAADAEAVLFSIKSFAAAIIAYYISLRIGFAQPVWAVTTVHLVSQPLAGAVVSKAFSRVLGTCLLKTVKNELGAILVKMFVLVTIMMIATLVWARMGWLPERSS